MHRCQAEVNVSCPITSNENLQSILDKGKELNIIRCQEKAKPVDQKVIPVQSCKPFKSKPKKPLWKIQYPHEGNYSKCRHQGGLVLNRNKMLSNDHLDTLARPKKVCLMF